MVGGEVEGRRAQLIAAAFRRVADSGFEGLRLRQVAEDVGIDHSTLHHHFATKQSLVEAVAAYTTRQFWETSPPAPDRAAALRAHLRVLQQMIVEQPDLFAVTVELDLRARRDPAVAAAMAQHESGWRAKLVEILTGLVPDPATSAELVIATVKGVRLLPDAAGPVLDLLAATLTGDRRG
ncbi:TetR/AcrR family transcriptional regulator [Pseudonocardia hierapolitana]|uniref:TetR/AcrR family transcriptional regulator n=1 Tax=Pseudonocardia hierapolitana TaxID=1128676 RepID=UPI00147951F2|nr:TetR/AcrR family transcriptional regulator [Pseudonocardia hierapolitana]